MQQTADFDRNARWGALILVATLAAFGWSAWTGRYPVAEALWTYIPFGLVGLIVMMVSAQALIRNQLELAMGIAVVALLLWLIEGIRLAWTPVGAEFSGAGWLAAACGFVLTCWLIPEREHPRDDGVTRVLCVGLLLSQIFFLGQGLGAAWLGLTYIAAAGLWLASRKTARTWQRVLKALAIMHLATVLYVNLTAYFGLQGLGTLVVWGLVGCVQLALLAQLDKKQMSRQAQRYQQRISRYRRVIRDQSKARRSSENYLRNITSHASIGIVEVDLAGEIMYTNQAFVRLMGLPDESGLLGTSIINLIHEDDRGAVFAIDLEETQHEVRLLSHADHAVVAQLSRTQIAADQRQYILFFNDITPMRQAEELQRKMELELRLSQKLESVGKLAAGIAHEINTPVQYVQDSAHFIQDGAQVLDTLLSKLSESLTDEQKQAFAAQATEHELDFYREELPAAFGRTFEGIERVSSIVASMKQLAYPDPQERQPCDLNKIVNNAIAVARHEYTDIAELDVTLDAAPMLDGFQGELTQVLVNVIVNAGHAIADSGKYSADNKGQISLRTELAEDSVKVFIEDNGCGIPEAVKARIFDPYFTTKQVGRGSGQGLAISRAIVVDRHGGGFQVESLEDHGTTFIIELPTLV